MVFQDFLIGLLILIVGAAFCLVGYRFFRILIAIWGFFVGFNLGAYGMAALFGQNFLGTVTGWILGIVVGIVIALLAYFLYYIAVVVLGASVGYAFGSGLMGAIGLNNPGFLAVLVGVALAAALSIVVLVLNVPKIFIMILTAIGGAATMVTGVLLVFGQIHTTALQYGHRFPLVYGGNPLPASDQYALALMVYQWLCGRGPFQGTMQQLYLQQLDTPPPGLRDLVPSISRPVEEVVLKALAKDPRQRFPHVQEFAYALKQASQTESMRLSGP